MGKNEDVLIDAVYIDGLSHAKLRIKGRYATRKQKLKILVDGVLRKLEDNIILDKSYVERRILKQDSLEFDGYVSLEKKIRNVSYIWVIECFFQRMFLSLLEFLIVFY